MDENREKKNKNTKVIQQTRSRRRARDRTVKQRTRKQIIHLLRRVREKKNRDV